MGARPMPSPEVAIRELQRISDAALASLSMQELLNELLERIATILSSDTAAFLLLDEVAGDLVAQAAKGIEEEVEQGVRIPVGRGFAGRIAAERKPVAIEDVDHADILNPILREKGIRSLLGVPLMVEGRVIGVLHVGTLVPRHFTEQEHDLLQFAADRAAIAIEHARLHAQRHVVETIQRAMLPAALPVIPGIAADRDLPPGRGRRPRRRRLVRRLRARPRQDRARDRRRGRPWRGGRRPDGAGADGAARLRARGPRAGGRGRPAQPDVRDHAPDPADHARLHRARTPRPSSW